MDMDELLTYRNLAACYRTIDTPDCPLRRDLLSSLAHSPLPIEPDCSHCCRLDSARCWLYALSEQE